MPQWLLIVIYRQVDILSLILNFNSPCSLVNMDYGCLWLPAYLFYHQKGIVLPFYV